MDTFFLRSSLNLKGTFHGLQKALENLYYKPDLHFHGTDLMYVSIQDLGNTGNNESLWHNITIPITINSVNDAPLLNKMPSIFLIISTRCLCSHLFFEN